MIFAFDIETIPNPALAEKLPAPELALGNLKDPIKIAEKVDAAREKQIERMALDAATGRVLSFSCANDDGEHGVIMQADTDDEEIRVVCEALEILGKAEARVVTWNGKGFDLPFLFKRAAILRIPNPAAPLSNWTRRYDEGQHIDLMKIWANYENHNYTKLDFFAATVLGTHKIDVDVTKFYSQMQTEQGQNEILEYNLQDARITWQAFKVMQGHLF